MHLPHVWLAFSHVFCGTAASQLPPLCGDSTGWPFCCNLERAFSCLDLLLGFALFAAPTPPPPGAFALFGLVLSLGPLVLKRMGRGKKKRIPKNLRVSKNLRFPTI